MRLVLDTDILIDLGGKKKYTIEKLEKLRVAYPGLLAITFINYFEFLLGLEPKSLKKREEAIDFIEVFDVLQTTKRTAKILAELKNKYDSLGKTFPLADLLVASITIENNMILVTRDRDFEVIEELDKIIL